MILDPQNPPSNWCFIYNPDEDAHMILAKWSKSHYCWIGHNLLPIFSISTVYKYEETKYKTLYELKEIIK